MTLDNSSATASPDSAPPVKVSTRVRLAERETTAADALVELAGDPDFPVWAAALRNPSFPVPELVRLAEGVLGGAPFTATVGADEQALMVAWREADFVVTEKFSQKSAVPKTMPETLRSYVSVFCVLGNPSFPSGRLEEIVAAAIKDPSWWGEALTEELVRVAVANPACPYPRVWWAVKSPGSRFKSAVASNPALPPDIVEVMVSGRNHFVLCCLLMNPAAEEYDEYLVGRLNEKHLILLAEMSDQWREYALDVAMDKSSSVETTVQVAQHTRVERTLRGFLFHESPLVRAAAEGNPSTDRMDIVGARTYGRGTEHWGL